MSIVEEGIKQYLKIEVGQAIGVQRYSYVPKKETKLYVYNAAKDPKELPFVEDNAMPKQDTNKSVIQKSLKDVQDNNIMWKYMSVKEKIQTITTSNNAIPDIELSDKDKEILRRLELEHEKNIKNQTAALISPSIVKAYEKEHTQAQVETKEKPKLTLSVKPKQSVNIRRNF